jgi:hypothetical protein
VKRFFLTIATLAWLLGVGFGLRWHWSYGSRPGPPAAPPRRHPRGGPFPPRPGRPTLLLFAHPRCPCTRASIAELARLIPLGRGVLDAGVFFVRPEGLPGDVMRGPLWRDAAAIPGVRVAQDAGGAVARGFGARTSGQVLLYDGEGRLRFSGGITPARGEAGDSAGRAAILALLPPGANGPADRAARRAESPVFGCSLLGAGRDNEADGRGKKGRSWEGK